jgi:hypothetical protein
MHCYSVPICVGSKAAARLCNLSALFLEMLGDQGLVHYLQRVFKGYRVNAVELQSQGKHGDYCIHGLALPPHLTACGNGKGVAKVRVRVTLAFASISNRLLSPPAAENQTSTASHPKPTAIPPPPPPTHRLAAVRRRVPVGRRRRVQPRAHLLHYRRSYYITVWPVEAGQQQNAAGEDRVGPLADLVGLFGWRCSEGDEKQ